jgi:fido (protein-threonine AMPylation protein)
MEVMKGWLVASSPSVRPGDTTPWFSSFWEFCQRYCDQRFGEAWHLSPEQSLLLHAENTVVPKQVVVISPRANNLRIELAYGTSLFALREKELPRFEELEVRNGLRVFRLEHALIRAPQHFFEESPLDAQVALKALRTPSSLLIALLEGGHSIIAGRLVGAFRTIGQTKIADEIVRAMGEVGHVIREKDPFEVELPELSTRATSPIVLRLQTLWRSARDAVVAEFPKSQGLPKDPETYLARIDDVYTLDAYHSLSIEGYTVTPELIEKVMSGSWDPENDQADRTNLNALAARGYWQAFQEVRRTVARILERDGDTTIVRRAHRDWYRQLFTPNVQAGLLDAGLLAGYRSQAVFLRNSHHIPPRAEIVPEAMEALFDLIEAEPEPSVRAVLGHWLFGYVHPFPDGNGRVARFVMNTLLAGGGYPWTVIRVDDRDDYLSALERASVAGDVGAFAKFVAKQMAFKPASTRKPKRRS